MFIKTNTIIAVLAICSFSSFAAISTSPFAVPVLSSEEAETANNNAIAQLQQTISSYKIVVPNEPVAVPVLTPDEALKANNNAIRDRERALFKQRAVSLLHGIGLNSNRISFLIALVPLLFIMDVLLLFKKKRKPAGKIGKYFSLQRRFLTLMSVSLLAFGLLVFVPWSVYLGNISYFKFIFHDFLSQNLIYLSLLICVGTIILLVIPPKISNCIVALVAGLGLCVYAQSMFMNLFLGEMNGTEPDWSQHRFWGLTNIGIWTVIIVVTIVMQWIAKKNWSNILSFVTGGILLMEIVAAGSMVYSAPDEIWERSDSYYIDFSNQFQLSKEKNVIVFIFDTFGSDFIRLCFEKYPNTEKIVKDFIWFNDARSNYHLTFPGLINELTGSLIYPAHDSFELMDNAWKSASAKSFYSQVKQYGYDTRLFFYSPVDMGDKSSFCDYFTNIIETHIEYKINKKLMQSCLVKISGFSSLPYNLKKHFFYDSSISSDVVQQYVVNHNNVELQTEAIRNDRYYNKIISKRITTDAKTPVLAFHYTVGTHAPWHIDEKCIYHREPFPDPFPTIQSCFFIISELIQQLKENNIYDQTAILICSDHGTNTKYSTPFDMGFLIKPFNNHQDNLVKDGSRIQSIDVLPTVLSLACGDKADYSSFEGFCPSKIPQDRKRIVSITHVYPDFPPFDIRGKKAITIKRNCITEYLFDESDPSRTNRIFIQRIPLLKSFKNE